MDSSKKEEEKVKDDDKLNDLLVSSLQTRMKKQYTVYCSN